MSKKILMMRHGEAVSLNFGTNDFERRLSENGMNQAIRAGKELLSRKIAIHQILHSTAARTTMTAELVAQINRIDASDVQGREDFYQTSVGGLLNSINLFNKHWETVLIIGHNPTLSYLIEYLGGSQGLFLGTAHMVCLSFDAESWMEIGQSTGSADWSYEGK